MILEADKAGKIHLGGGIPTCRSGRLQARDTRAARRACRKALIGKGKAVAQVAFAEQRPIDVSSRLLVFNGGEHHGRATLYIHAYFSNPISGAIVTTVRIKKAHRGRFGTLAIARIPRITGGHGSIISFHLRIFKHVKGRRDRWRNPISSRCRDGKLKVDVLGKFEDGSRAQTEIIRACGSRRR